MSDVKRSKITDSEITNKRQISKRGRQRDVIYPILSECASLVKDEYWRQFYDDLAVGKPTKGIWISNGVVQTSNRRNGFSYNITDKAPEVIIAELHHLLIAHTSICSRKDMIKQKQFMKEIEEELEEYDRGKWTSIKRKHMRTMLLVDYAINLGKRYKLSWPAIIGAYNVITNAFESKTHNSKDVSYENGEIVDIDDIELDTDKGVIVNIRKDDIPDSCPDDEPKHAVILQSLFEPYLAAWIKTIK
jgi:hypothetical protein